MNRTGQVTLGAIILTFVGVVVAVALFAPGITEPISTVTNTITVVNQTYASFPATGINLTLGGQANYNIVVSNSTSGAVVPATNYTVTNYVVATDGTLTSVMRGLGGLYGSRPVNISATREPYGYATDAGSRVVTSLVILLAALAIMSIAAYPIIKNQFDI